MPLALLSILVLSSCGGDTPTAAPTDDQLAKPAPERKASPEGDAEEDGVSADYVYNPIGKRDPFRTFITTEEGEEIRSPTPLQRYEIDQYALTGIIWGTERPRALVEDPEGIGHVVELGTYIGKNWGKVTRITSTVVVVTEEYLTPDGALVTNPIEIKLVPSEK